MSGGIIEVKVSEVRPLAGQARTYFDPAKLVELADSIHAIGQLTPIQIVALPEPDEDGRKYELLEGERRWRVFRDNGWSPIRAEVVTVVSRDQHWARSFVANMGREGYTPMETARGIAKMLELEPYSSMEFEKHRFEAIGRACGKSGTWANHYFAMTKLSQEVQAMMDQEREFPLRVSIAQQIAYATSDHAKQLKIALSIVRHRLTGAKARNLIRLTLGDGEVRGGKQRRPSEDVEIIKRAVRSMETSIDTVNSVPKLAFDRYLANTPKLKQLKLAEKLIELRSELDILIETITK